MAKLAGTVTVELSTPNREILYSMHKMLCNILVEQRKIVQGNAANFDQLRAIRLLLEKKAILSDVEKDGGQDGHLPPSPPLHPDDELKKGWCGFDE